MPLNVVITGGSSGIGAAMVRVFAKAGHRVLFTYLNSLKSAQALEDSHKNVTKVSLDQGDIASIAQFARLVHIWCGSSGLDVLINNAALGSATVERYTASTAYTNHRENTNSTNPSLQTSANHNGPSHSKSVLAMLQGAAKEEALVRVNALGPLWVTKALMDIVKSAAERPYNNCRAVIIFIGSVGGGSSAIFPEYCPADLMSKSAITYLTKHLAAEHVKDNIDILCVSPGATETDMFRKSTLSKVSDVNAFINSMPKRRLIQPDDVAETVLWLATKSPPGLFQGAVLDASMGLAVRPGLQTESYGIR